MVINFFTRKSLNAAETSKELDGVYNEDAPSYRTVVRCIAPSKYPQRAFEHLPRQRLLSTTTTNQSIEVVEWIAMCDQ